MSTSLCRCHRSTLLTVSSLLFASLVAIPFLATEVRATSIVGDGFQVGGTVIGEAFGPVSGTAGGHLGVTFGDGDVVHTLVNGAQVFINWVDQDTFWVGINASTVSLGQPNSPNFGVDITLSNLSFLNQGVAQTISGVSFDPNGGGYLGFFQPPFGTGVPVIDPDTGLPSDNPSALPVKDPVVTFGPSSIRVVFGDDWLNDSHPRGRDQLIGDQLSLFFDVRTQAPTATPEPETVALLCCGLLVLGLARRYALRSSQS